MKDVIAYAAGAILVGYVAYIFISPDEPTRVNRACIPVAGATRLLGAAMHVIDENSAESWLHNKPHEALAACRNTVWYWAKDSRNPPKFPEDDALFGTFLPKSTSPTGTTTAPVITAPTTSSSKTVQGASAPQSLQDPDQL